ncbi:MAG: class I SAM-dependent RNA methyltransferase [Bacilli bacterium]|nr:class I SAM-dependent RNA methyltransferase [Bacilli bacterium]
MSYKIDRIDDFGRGITKVEDTICFVSNALENEEVDIEIIDKKSKFMEAKSTAIIKESQNRKEALCPYYLSCGGCNIMHMTYTHQLEFKKSKVERILSKFANISNVVECIIPTQEFNYRNKVVLKVLNGKIGFYKDRSNDLVNIDMCLLCSNKINEVIDKLKSINLNGVNEVLIRSNYKDESLIALTGLNIEDLKDKLDFVDNIVINDKVVKGNGYLIDKIGQYLFKVSYDSFFQVNSIGVNLLYDEVFKNVGNNDTILDLYCGAGTIGMYLSKNANKIYGVEINKSAIEDANYNMKLNNVTNMEFLCSDVALIKNKYKNVDLVVIDPPRSGLSKEAIKNVLDINSNRIIYVSCDPVTLARDLNILKENYDVKNVKVVDMFPNTYHVECVCLLMKK